MPETPSPVDLETLLAPIAGPSPTGTDPRADFSAASPYLRLRDLRADARAAERMADASGDGDAAPTANWRPIRDQALALIAREAKDIEVACWLLEALLRTDGMAGFAAGVGLITGLIDSFWDGLHPMPDEEDGLALRFTPLAGLNGLDGDGTLIQPLRKLVLFERPDGSHFAVWHYRQSMEVAGIGDAAKRQQRIKAGVALFNEIEAEARTLAPLWAAPLAAATADALDRWDALATAIDARGGGDTPNRRVRDLLVEIKEIADRFAPHAAPAAPAPGDLVAEGFGHGAEASPTPAAAQLQGREDALGRLIELSEFFRRSEPHSPLAYTLAEAVRRARLTWPELLEEVVPDAASRDLILLRLGIRPNQQRE